MKVVLKESTLTVFGDAIVGQEPISASLTLKVRRSTEREIVLDFWEENRQSGDDYYSLNIVIPNYPAFDNEKLKLYYQESGVGTDSRKCSLSLAEN